MDADMMVRRDITELFALADPNFDVQVVKHNYQPKEGTKIVGVAQQQYPRKNWSSVMLFADADFKMHYGVDAVNNRSRDWLHQFAWTEDIGDLPETWNWLEGHSSLDINPANVHFTRGTPDLPGYEDVAYADEYWEYAKAAGFRREHNSL
jgi:hypothetical protein